MAAAVPVIDITSSTEPSVGAHRSSRFSLGNRLRRSSEQPEMSSTADSWRSRASFIEDGMGGSDEADRSASTRESRALALVGADESIASASQQRKSGNVVVSDWSDASTEVERARQRIESEAGHHHQPDRSLFPSSTASSSHSRSPSAAEQLLPLDFDARTHPIDQLLSLASTLHSTSKARPPIEPKRFHRRNRSAPPIEDDPRLTLSTRLFAVLADRGSNEGALMYALALRAGWGIEPDEKAGLELLQSAVADALEELEEARRRGGGAEEDVDREKRALGILRGALYELGNSFYHGLGASKDESKVMGQPFATVFPPFFCPWSFSRI
jgi:hypothetical protein